MTTLKRVDGSPGKEPPGWLGKKWDEKQQRYVVCRPDDLLKRYHGELLCTRGYSPLNDNERLRARPRAPPVGRPAGRSTARRPPVAAVGTPKPTPAARLPQPSGFQCHPYGNLPRDTNDGGPAVPDSFRPSNRRKRWIALATVLRLTFRGFCTLLSCAVKREA
ncbi:hypothetical protein EMIHUDRAFT_204681 [Emiliania huxleyi CCMP1516]|uniref:Uncharacterized protein n=2 Tax=Emiliania huxleyi TaxID=2903 RepID=A0A0D3JW52_EMIH1|nr:hypothetical protein EMIHUDRAFT_204681 [Emiliania huxleyi CCMP1516]EOD27737.1 hypothetical protein EMIHUDRAFT_204681 [Emiliania huxleyi CCMP1516]|eukprot:XP_005780166.1 hypothetical protein EMIHUDRAFT_204681 [Emiliania huxleyi CCMP1516]